MKEDTFFKEIKYCAAVCTKNGMLIAICKYYCGGYMKTIICLFTNIDKARLATETLLLSGFQLEQLNVIVQELIAKNKLFISSQKLKYDENKTKYPLTGLESLLGGKQAMATPDAGRVLCAGPEATSSVKVANFKTDHGLKSALMEFQMPESAAEYYENGIKEGGLLLWIRTDDLKAAEVVRIMEYRNGLKILSF
jgi:hypothetical protein